MMTLSLNIPRDAELHLRALIEAKLASNPSKARECEREFRKAISCADRKRRAAQLYRERCRAESENALKRVRAIAWKAYPAALESMPTGRRSMRCSIRPREWCNGNPIHGHRSRRNEGRKPRTFR